MIKKIMSDNLKKIIEFQTNVSDFQSEIETIKQLINDVANEDTSNKTFAELELQAKEIENVLSILKVHGMESTAEFTKLESKITDIATQAKLIDDTVGRMTDTTFNDLHNAVGDVKSEMELLQDSIQNVLDNDTKSQTFEQLIGQQKVLNDLLKTMKKEGLDNSKIYEQLQSKFEEIRATAKQIGDNVGWATGDTFNSLSEKMGNVMVGTHNVADGMSIMSQQADTTSGSMGKLYNSIDFLDRSTTLPIASSISQFTDLLGFSVQAMSEFNGANNAASRAMEQANKAQEALNKAAAAGVNTTELSARAQQAMATATEASTQKTKQFRMALMSIGIGVVLLLLGQLIENWDKVSKAIDKFLPMGAKVSDIFGKIKEVAYGVGNALVNYFLTPLRTIIKVIQGDFSGAMNELKNGLNVVNNFETGMQKGREANERDRQSKQLENDLKQRDKRIELMEAKGQNTRLERTKRFADEQKKLTIEKNTEGLAQSRFEEMKMRASWEKEDRQKAKADADKAKQEAKQKADEAKRRAEEIRRFNTEVQQSITDMTTVHTSQREKELYEWSKSYKNKLEEAKKVGGDITKVEEENNLKIKEINQKYINAALEELKKNNETELDEFEQKRNAIEEKYNKMIQNIGNVDEAVKNQIIEARNNAIDEVDKLEEKHYETIAEKELQRVYDLEVKKKNILLNFAQNNADDTIGTSSTIDQQLLAIENLNSAKIEQEIAFFEAEKIRLKDQKDELLLLEQTHADNLLAINEENAKAKIELQKRERAGQWAVVVETGKMLGAISELSTEGTLLQKSLAISSATINTIDGAVAAYTSYLDSAIPAPYNQIAGILAASTVVASGVANVKKIAQVKVGKKSGSASIPSMSFDTANFSAPQVDAGEATKNGDVRITNGDDIVIKTYLLDSDLEDAERRKSMIDNLSGF